MSINYVILHCVGNQLLLWIMQTLRYCMINNETRGNTSTMVSAILVIKLLVLSSIFFSLDYWSDRFVLCCYFVSAKVKEQGLPITYDLPTRE